MTGDAADADALLAFVNRFLDDVASGGAQPLAHYQAAHPGCEATIAAEYGRLTQISGDAVEAPVRGRRVAGYELIEEIGRGGQAVVYLAQDLRLPRKVALKVVHDAGVGASREAMARFRREAALVSRLDHPGLCTVYESGHDHGGAFIAMRHLEGGSLAEAIARGVAAGGGPGVVPLPGEPVESGPRQRLVRALELLEQTARALDAAHRAGVVHRDVKPSNVLLTGDGAPVLVDFGLAHDASDVGLTLSGVQFGTPAYMAPEQVAGDAKASDARTDVYALGVTAFEALTGVQPFTAASRQALYRRILDGRAPDPCRLVPGLPRELRVVLQTAMDVDPDRRYASAAELADDLRRVRDRQPILAEPASLGLRGWRWVQRNPLPAVLIAALGVGLGVTSWSIVAMRAARTRADATARRLDLTTIDGLSRDAAEVLWPERQDLLPRLDEWLATAAAFVADCLRRHAGFADAEATRTLAALARFTSEPLGAMAQVRERRRRIEAVAAASLHEAADVWRACVADLSPRLRAPLPRFGLVPLRRDPSSGLHEFWLVRSGRRPETRADGGYHIDGESGAVMVLLPGGRVSIGAQRDDPSQPGYCALAEDDERPVHEVELDPFFCSKYELTQGQWLRLCGSNPSRFTPGGREWAAADSPDPMAHPVEQVTTEEAELWFGRFGLQLPTEAQWEYAAGGGRSSPWWPGEHEGDLHGAANLADRALHSWHPEYAVLWDCDDGFALHAPVDAFAPNPFGLVGCIGNVAEWCADAFGRYTLPARPGDGRRDGGDQGKRVVRGGNFEWDAVRARKSYRSFEVRGNRTYQVGVRPVMAWRP